MKNNLEWNVLNYDWNSKKIVPYNVCCVIDREPELQKLLKTHTDRDTFNKQLRRWCMYHFWSKIEYEISVGDAFEDDMNKLEKWDIYGQIMLNFERFSNYVWENWREKNE